MKRGDVHSTTLKNIKIAVRMIGGAAGELRSSAPRELPGVRHVAVADAVAI
jgi:hypothetical protein